MVGAKEKISIDKRPLLDGIHEQNRSSMKKYKDFFVGHSNFSALVKFEMASMLILPMPGALGFLLRKRLLKHLFRKVGSGVLLGRNVSLRHPGKIDLGERVAVDDDCLLDAKGAGEEGIKIGDDVVIARGTIIQGKNSWVDIGDNCTIGSQCQLSSVSGISLGKFVMMAGQCYIGGGRYRSEDRDLPMAEQGLYSEGPVTIGSDVWLGAGVIVLDGVSIGQGCIVGAGAVIREDLSEYAVVMQHNRLVVLPRS